MELINKESMTQFLHYFNRGPLGYSPEHPLGEELAAIVGEEDRGVQRGVALQLQDLPQRRAGPESGTTYHSSKVNFY